MLAGWRKIYPQRVFCCSYERLKEDKRVPSSRYAEGNPGGSDTTGSFHFMDCSAGLEGRPRVDVGEAGHRQVAPGQGIEPCTQGFGDLAGTQTAR